MTSSRLDDIEARHRVGMDFLEKMRGITDAYKEEILIRDYEFLVGVARAAETLLTSADGYEAEARRKQVWNERDPDVMIVQGIQRLLRPALEVKKEEQK